MVTDSRGNGDRLPTMPTVAWLFEEQVVRKPYATALVFQDTTVSYDELNRRANQLARLLISRGVGPEHVVAFALKCSPELVIAQLAVLKAGAGYLPLDPDYPTARLRFILDDADPAFLLVCTATNPALPITGTPRLVLDDPSFVDEVACYPDMDVSDVDRVALLSADNCAYVI